MNKLIRELRRREVFRTAGLYVGVAWITIEAASVLLPAFEAPEWVLRALIILAVIGLPVAVVLAWVYDITDKGIEVQAEATDTVVIPFGGRKADFVVIGVLAVALIFAVYMNITGRVEIAPTEIPPVSILIADFDNRTGDDLFTGTVEQALQIGLESAPFVTGYRRDAALRVATALQRAGDVLDEETARLVAVREGIKLILAGSIEQEGRSYRLYARVIDPRGGEVLAEADAEADDKLKVLEAVGALSVDLREELGDDSLDRDKLVASETFTAKTLEAAKAYARAQSLQYNGKYEEAIDFYRQAVDEDPNFGRALSGWALSEQSLGRTDEAKALFDQALANLDTMTERERLRTLGLYYSQVSHNRPKAIESYTQLVQKYPADDAARNGLAIQYFFTLDFNKALEQGGELLEIYPNSVMGRSNYALYAMYATDFDTAVAEATRVRELDPGYFKAWLPVAVKALAEDDVTAARQAYESMQPHGSRGRLTAQIGLADTAMFAGDFARARELFTAGAAEATKVGSSYFTGTMRIGLAEALLREGAAPDVVSQALVEALEIAGGLSRQVPAALMYLEIGDANAAKLIARSLGQNLQPQDRAYAALINGLFALRSGDSVTAIDSISAGIELADLWLLRFHRGRAYLEAGYIAEALDDFMTCAQRQGEAAALFLDDLPTFRYVAEVPYWLGRAQQGLGMQQAAQQNFAKFAARRAEDDPLGTDARTRLP